jgi:purine-binding chemotaxis protein CheW
MSESRKESEHLLDQQLAVGAYLEALLAPVPEADEPIPPQYAEPAPAPAVLVPPVIAPPAAETPPPVEAKAPPAIETPPAEEAKVPPAPPVEAPAIEETPPAAEQLVETPAEPAPQAMGRPDWAQERFQVLLFQVAGLKMAVPLVELNGVIPWDDTQVTEMPNHQSWFLGLRDHLDQRVKLIDIAAVVLPRDRYAALGPADSSRLSKIVLIDNYAWGLACEDVAEVITLEPDEVKWRTVEGGRPWLAGTVINHMCALLNSAAFAQSLRTEGLPSGV